jgi:hypothetical protein
MREDQKAYRNSTDCSTDRISMMDNGGKRPSAILRGPKGADKRMQTGAADR